jgi:general secretion pathway protein M
MNTPRMSTWRQALGQAWRSRSVRERRLLALALAVLLAALLWQILLAPVLGTWRQAPAMQAQLDAQWQQMLDLQAQARQLQKASRQNREEAQAWLEHSVQEVFGQTARVSVQDRRVRLTLQGADASALSQWLTQARQNAQLLPVQVQLQTQTQAKEAASPNKPKAGQATVLWQGSVELQWP